MKTIITVPQDQSISYMNEDMFNICASILVVALVMVFILVLVKRIFNQQLKKKIVENGISEKLAESVLHSGKANEPNSELKWFLIFGWLGVGLSIVHYTNPLGLHSLAILSLSIAAAFFCYFIYARKHKN